MDYIHIPTKELLAQMIGAEATEACYRGSLRALFESESADQHIGSLLIARELVARWLKEELSAGDILGSPQAVKTYLQLRFAGRDYETFLVLFLDAQNRLIAAEELFRGTLTQTAVYPREIVKRALQSGAGAVIFAHNHPSGVAEPSQADRHLTEQLKLSLALVDVRVLDHFIVAGNSVTSLAERGEV